MVIHNLPKHLAIVMCPIDIINVVKTMWDMKRYSLEVVHVSIPIQFLETSIRHFGALVLHTISLQNSVSHIVSLAKYGITLVGFNEVCTCRSVC